MRPFAAIVFGTLSDKIGRKPIIMAGLALALVTYFPIFSALTDVTNPKLAAAQRSAKISVTVDTAQCSFQGSPIARDVDFTSGCDIAKCSLTPASASYETIAQAGAAAVVQIGDKTINVPSGTLAAGPQV